MTKFNNMKIGTRIIAGFLVVVLISAIIGGIGIYSLRTVNGSYKVAYTDSTAALECTEQISESFQRIRMNLYGMALATSLTDKQYYQSRVDEMKGIIDENIGAYRDILVPYKPEDVVTEIALIDAVQETLIAFGAVREEFIKNIAMNAERRDEAIAWLGNGGQLRELALNVDDAIGDLITYNIDYAQNQIVANARLAFITTWVMVAAIIIGAVLAVTIGVYISRTISTKIGILVDTSNKLAEGDVEVEVKADTKDEIGELMEAFGRMVESTREQAHMVERVADGDLTVDVRVKSSRDLLGQKLQELVQKNNEVLSNIREASVQVATGSGQISDTSLNLSQGATEQASSIEELSAAISEISEQVKKSVENAQEARTQSQQTGREVEDSNRQMQELIAAISEINDKSAEIGKIIKTIDDIAFQTNILALNAAVEAARAGQHGKGFAVVADEVRNLAGKSAEAAKDTTTLIEETVHAVEKGTKFANVTAEAMEKVVSNTEIVTHLVDEIAKASDEQAAAVTQVNAGVEQISTVVQNNAATAEESAATAEELSSQAQMLNEQIALFRLDEHRGYGTGHARIGTKEPELYLPELSEAGDLSFAGKY